MKALKREPFLLFLLKKCVKSNHNYFWRTAMTTKKQAKLLALSTILYSGTALSGETLLYDFNNYIPSLDKAYEKMNLR